ncbi:MAG: glycosyltransferase family 4 protein [Succinivibrionaceae bacterium]|nr:glycosyltransferase family 4 protein [Succinivibrionaceae bacterium]
MRILFYLFQNINRQSGVFGGIERHTLVLINGLKRFGYEFFFSYSHDDDTPAPGGDDGLRIRRSTGAGEIRKYLLEKKIDIVHIQQSDGDEIQRFREAADGTSIRILATYHFQPGYELMDLAVHNILVRLSEEKGIGRKIKWTKRLALLPYYRIKKTRQMKNKFSRLLGCCDALVFLCPEYITLFNSYLGNMPATAGETFICNCTSFSRYATEDDILKKSKTVLVVARLEEHYKRISLAIRLWEKLTETGRFDDWSMVIVGDGYSKNQYEKMARSLPRISFEGRQDPVSYYQKAAIYLNTSISEGLSLCCIEAMQFGVVPFSFDTWSAVFSLIDSGENGFIIHEGNMESYLEKLAETMTSHELRQRLARAAVEKSKLFSQEKMVEKYRACYETLHE